MARLLAIDYGLKRCGIAVSDPNKIIATALQTVPANELLNFLKRYTLSEKVEMFVIGYPRKWDNTDSEIVPDIKDFVEKLIVEIPGIPYVYFDERYTSKLASKAMVEAGFKKKDRQIKSNIDKMAAAILLREFMDQNKI